MRSRLFVRLVTFLALLVLSVLALTLSGQKTSADAAYGLFSFGAQIANAAPKSSPTTSSNSNPAPTRTPRKSLTPTSTQTNTPTATPTNTATATSTHMSTATPTNTATATPTNTPSGTFTSTPAPSNTSTSTSTPTATPTNTATPAPSSTSTDTPTPTLAGTATSTFTPSATPTNTATATATSTSTDTPTPTQTGTATGTFTPSATPTNTATATLTSTSTDTPTPTFTPTNTPTPTLTPTPGPAVFPLKASANHRYLVDQNNVPFLIRGDSPQGLMAVSPADQQTYLAARANQGLNTMWVSLLCTTYSSICPDINAYGGVPPFTNPGDLSTPNEAYFAKVDAMLNLAAQYHMVVFLGPIETGYWLPTLRSNGTTKAYNYGVYLGNRYKNFPNIIWLSGNDFQTWTNTTDDAVVRAVANGIQSVDSNHIQTVELEYDTSGSLDDPTWVPLIGLDTAYSYYPEYAQVLKEYNRANIPTWFIEGVYEYQGYQGGYLGPYTLRNQEYWTQLSGSAGQLYGNADLFGFPPGWQTSNWQTSPGITQYVHANNFFIARPWYNLIPDQTHTVVTAGYGTFQNCCLNQNSDYLTAARTPDGKLVVAYMPTRRTITVDMSQLSGLVTARWYDPVNGTYLSISGSPFLNSGLRQFTPAASNSGGNGDWLLVLEAN